MSTTEQSPRLRVIRDEPEPATGRVLAGEVIDERQGASAVPAVPLDAREPERQPVIPRVLRDAEQRAALVRHWWDLSVHAVAFHTVRAPKYALRACLRAPVGGYRLAGMAVAFLWDLEGHPLRSAAVIDRDHKAYQGLVKERNARIRRRGQAYFVLGVLLAVAAVMVWALVPAWALWLAAAVGVWLLAQLGSPPGRPLLESSVTTFAVPRLTHPMIEAAMGALGIGLLTSAMRSGSGLSFPSDVARDGAGYRAEVDLPLGVTAGDILDKRDRLASALRRPLGTVWPEGDPDTHEGRLVLWVADRDLAKAGRLAWPLEKTGEHDIFKPVFLGRDPRGSGLLMPLMFNNVLIGAMPRQGKTAAARVIAAAGALDPTCELWLHELKGTGDFDGLEPCAHRYMSGIDDDAVRYTAESLSMLREEAKARGARLKALPPEWVPDKKVTRQVASRRNLRLHPILAVFDEAQNLFSDKTYGRQAGEDAEYLIKIGPALGIVLVFATQRPDKESLPTGVSGNVSQRLCFHVAGQVENDMILGTSAYKQGWRATAFRAEVEAGIGIQRGARTKPTVVRCSYLDGPATARIGQRGRALREAQGTLTGHAAGQSTEPERVVVNVARDVLAVFGPDESALWNEVLLARLGDGIRPGYYDGWAPAQLTAALKAGGVDVVKDVFRDKRTKRGIHRADLVAALELEEA